MGIVEVIARGFIRGGLSYNAQKRHLQAMMTIKNKRVRFDNEEKKVVISFSNDHYLEGFDWDHDDPMVITVAIHNYIVKRILVDQGSLANILYSVTTISMNITKANLKPQTT